MIAQDVLLEFDLLNQAQAAVAAQDYALCVVAAWTVCELRIGALVRSHNVSVGPREPIWSVTKKLLNAGHIDTRLATRLDTTRSDRNDFLHSGIEPSETNALDGLKLAAEMLRPIVPNLQLRAKPKLLML